jgi:hypothetical protein
VANVIFLSYSKIKNLAKNTDKKRNNFYVFSKTNSFWIRDFLGKGKRVFFMHNFLALIVAASFFWLFLPEKDTANSRN